MRVQTLLLPLLMLSVAVSGCVGGNDTGAGGDDQKFQPTCPAWTTFSTTDGEGNPVRPAALQAQLLHKWNNTSGPDGNGSWPDLHQKSRAIVPGSPGGLMLNGEHPVDFYEIKFEFASMTDVSTQLRVQTEGGRSLLLHDMKADRYMGVLGWKDGTNLDDPSDFPTYRVELSNPDADPAPEALVLVWDHDPDKDGNPETDSYSLTAFSVYAWFRTC